MLIKRLAKQWMILLAISVLGGNGTQAQATIPAPFYLGVDLSYVNEMEDCGAVYQVDGVPRDPYQIFYDYGANLVRVRVWHTPTWTEYSTLTDVIRSLERAEALGMDTLLDFHYSDTWADPSKQIIPAAWAEITDVTELGEALYTYTYETLIELNELGLMPDLVQVGNEINSEMLRPENTSGYPIDWERNAALLNQAIRAVRDAGALAEQPPRVLLHIAQPESVEGWLLAATDAGVTDFDIVGLSYYPGWSMHSVETVGEVINLLRHKFATEVMIVETAYPWTLDGMSESAGNILNEEFLLDGYAATSDGQRQFLIDLAQTVFEHGGLGIVYWEPAWVSTDCSTLWGQGSHWENATFFDFENNNELLSGIEFLQHPYEYPVEVTITFEFADGATPETLYFWGDFTGMGRRPLRLSPVSGGYVLHTRLMPNTEVQYQFYGALPASAETVLLSASCVEADGLATLTIPDTDVLVQLVSGSCPAVIVQESD